MWGSSDSCDSYDSYIEMKTSKVNYVAKKETIGSCWCGFQPFDRPRTGLAASWWLAI